MNNLEKGFQIAKISLLILVGLILVLWLYRKTFGKYKARKIPLPSGGNGIPIYSDGTVWSPLRSVEMLYYSMFGNSDGAWWEVTGWGTDEESIFLVLGDKTQDQLAAILNAYEAKYERDLIADFKSELSGAALSRVLDYFPFVTA